MDLPRGHCGLPMSDFPVLESGISWDLRRHDRAQVVSVLGPSVGTDSKK